MENKIFSWLVYERMRCEASRPFTAAKRHQRIVRPRATRTGCPRMEAPQSAEAAYSAPLSPLVVDDAASDVSSTALSAWVQGEAGRNLVAILTSSLKIIARALETQLCRDVAASGLRQGAAVVQSDAVQKLVAKSLELAADQLQKEETGQLLAVTVRGVSFPSPLALH